MTPKPLKKKMWAYYSPEGYLIEATRQDTREESLKAMLRIMWYWHKNDLRMNGYRLHRVQVTITPIRRKK